MVDLAYPLSIPFARRTGDRRLTSRFPLQQEVRYRLVQSKAMSAKGVGQSLDISSGGILFTTTDRLPVGRMVEIAVSWPARLNGTCPLQFVARGRVLRSDGKTAVVRIQRYEFRTRSMGPSTTI
ncbi:MAG TPA: PilZ domain-containing protein [Bryobacteraceae bacterium]|nr:PilZ domain-containing protein [Bryobacteraceae bacterium]